MKFPIIKNTLFFLMAAGAPLTAATVPLIYNSGEGHMVSGEAYMAGAQFDVGVYPLEVTALGLHNPAGHGLANEHAVGIWTETGSLLARIDFPAGFGGISVDGFVYRTLDETLLLEPGARYILAAHYPDPTLDSFRFNSGQNREEWTQYATWYNTRYAPSEDFVFPHINGGGFSYVGANAHFVAIPESGTVALALGGGVLALVLWRSKYRGRRRGQTESGD